MVEISVIIPVFNSEEFLNKCLDSLLNQSFTDIEIICVDDGSTDNSLKILKSYANKDDRVRVFTQENNGAGAARNLGLKYVNGKYILFVDSDDWFEEDGFKSLYDKAEQLNVDLLLFDSIEYKTNNQVAERRFFNKNEDDFSNLVFDYHYKNNKLVMNSFFVPWTKLYRTKFLLDKNIKFSEIPIFNDMYFNVAVTILASKIAYYPKILYHYNKINESSIQAKIKSNRKALIIVDVYKSIENFLRKNNFYEELELDYLSSKIAEYRSILNRVHKDCKEILFNKIKEDFMNLNLSNEAIFKKLYLKRYSFYIRVLNSNSFEELDKFNKVNLLDNIETDITHQNVLYASYVDADYVKSFEKIKDDIDKLELFDKDYYVNNYDYNGDIDPLIDYLCDGVYKGYNPSQRFNTEFYSEEYNITSNPLVYFVNKGYYEGKIKVNPTVNNIKSINRLKLDDEISNFKEVGVNNNIEGREEIIVSLTSFPERMHDIKYCIYSLLTQSFKPDKVILWLAYDEFPNKEEDIPQSVLNLKENGLTIKWCENYRSYKKLIPTLKEYPNSCIVTADDDLYYPKDWLQNLYEDHINYPNNIISTRCREVQLDDYNNFKKYNQWKVATAGTDSSFLNFPTNGAGTLFPPHSLNEKVTDDKLFRKLCPNTDDIWFWTMAVLNKTKIKKCKKLIPYCTYINPYREIYSENILWRENSKGRNDTELNNVLKEFPDIEEIMITDKP
ncbi:glycosyltransferase family 2 protein [Methanosphaera sp. Vir-13MRS]|uniref:glycosyltransferase family 2 protein n=1 Tax=Candidatus Methanosphaera massiliense TaxID=3017187 RepID=UPI0023805C63|nr:glycosyltransferase family 2 protein [Candidatus Methanosphaera massiliense]MDE4078785.1 glycosyltransferase family 2 protein [Candidatus Methanosphaera massiliense]